jgi:hypothetical protein
VLGPVRSILLLALACGLALLAWSAFNVNAHDPPPPPRLISPFPADQAWLITCGYTLPEESESDDTLAEDSDSDACGHSGSQWNRYAIDLQHVAGYREAEGQQVLAAAAGRVSRADWHDDLGWHVLLDHGDGYTTVYAHMKDRPLVQEGEEVPAGGTLGYVGCTGRCTGPHIHFVLWQDSVSIPLEPICGLTDLTYGQVIEGCPPDASAQAELMRLAGADFDGDGRPDLAFFYQTGEEAARIDILTSDGAVFAFADPESWWQGDPGYAFENVVHALAGDFDGDGRTDLAALVEGPDCVAWTPVLLAQEDRFAEPALGEWWNDPDFCAGRVQYAVSGDFDGDGLADIAFFSETDTGGARIDVLRSDGERFVAEPEVWWQLDDYVAGSVVHLVAVDFDGAGGTDLAALVEGPDCVTWAPVLLAQEGHFAEQALGEWWSDSDYCAGRVQYAVSGDFDGDGRADDLALLYQEDPFRRRIDVLLADGDRFAREADAAWWEEVAFLRPTKVRALLPGDFDDDGRTDLAALYDDGGCSTSLRVLASQGDGFQASEWWAADGYCAAGVRHAAP